MTAENVRALAPRQTSAIAMHADMDTLTVARMLAESGFFGEVKDAGKALAKILAGQEMGMGPIASLMGVYYQQGKVTYSANIMASAVKKSGHYTYRTRRLEDDECSLEFFERTAKGWESVGTSTFTLADAERAGLTTGPNKHNWSKFPRNMMFARAMSNGAKWYTPDVFGGVTPYTPDELGAEVTVGDDGEIKPVRPDIADVTPPLSNDGPPAASAEDRAKFDASWKRGVARAVACGVAPDDTPPLTATAHELKRATFDLLDQIKAREALNARLVEVRSLAKEHQPDLVEIDPAQMTDAEVHDQIDICERILDAAEQAEPDEEAF